MFLFWPRPTEAEILTARKQLIERYTRPTSLTIQISDEELESYKSKINNANFHRKD